jgi:nucleoid DNA-binding protein
VPKNKIKHNIIQEIQKELGGSYDEIESVVESQFDFVKYTIEKGLFNSIRLPYFGRFLVNPYRLKKLNIELAKNRKSK